MVQLAPKFLPGCMYVASAIAKGASLSIINE